MLARERCSSRPLLRILESLEIPAVPVGLRLLSLIASAARVQRQHAVWQAPLPVEATMV